MRTCTFLIQMGIDCNWSDKYGETTIFYAVKRARMEMVRALLNKGADLEATEGLRERFGAFKRPFSLFFLMDFIWFYMAFM